LIEILYKDSASWILRIVGMLFLVMYLLIYQDFSFSLTWSFLYVAIVLGTATAIATLGIQRFIPSLDTYYTPKKIRASDLNEPDSNFSKYLKREAYMKELFSKKSVSFLAAEDGLIGVPVLLSGINPLSVIIAGIVFSVIQIPRFTYLECLIKGVTYILICLIVLPKGILTVVAGHYLTDGLIWLGFKIRK